MQKILLVALIAILPFTQAQLTCADNPIVDIVETFVTQVKDNAEDSTTIQPLLDAIEVYKTATAGVWNSELGDNNYCSEYNGQNSCCTDTLVEVIPDLIAGFIYKQEKKTKPNMKGFLESIGKGLGSCGGKEMVQEFLGSAEVSTVMDKIKQCRNSYFFTQSSFVRSTVCQLCMDPTNIASLFDVTDPENPVLTVSEQSMTDYIEAVGSLFSCQQDAFDEVYDYIQSTLDLLPDTKKCNNYKKRVENKLSKQQEEKQGGQKGTKDAKSDSVAPNQPSDCEERTSFFGEGCLEEQNSGDAQSAETRLLLRVAGNRVLQTSSSFETSSTDGVVIYNKTDAKIQGQVDMVYDESQDSLDVNASDYDENKSNLIQMSLLVLLVVLGVAL